MSGSSCLFKYLPCLACTSHEGTEVNETDIVLDMMELFSVRDIKKVFPKVINYNSYECYERNVQCEVKICNMGMIPSLVLG